MTNNPWNDDDEPFNDIPDEVNGNHAPPAEVRMNRAVTAPPVQQPISQQVAQPVYEPEVEANDEEEDFSSVLSEARFKLELGRLYEMVMNHDIFQGADADDKAIKYVTKQFRQFAKEQMEIMLGMRQEPAKEAMAAADFPFNDLEVQTLKALASAATKGASASPAAQTFTPAPVQQPKQVGLNSIGVKKANPANKPVAKPQVPAKPLPQAPKAPIKREARSEQAIEQILREEGISREEYDRQYNPNYQPLTKPLHEMNEQELIARNAQSKTRRAVNPHAIPMPTQEQEEMIHTSRAQAASVNPQMQTIMSLLTQKKPT